MQFYSARSWVLNTQVCNSCTGMHHAIDGKKRRTVGVDLNVLCKEKTIGSTKAHRESRSLFNVQHRPSVHQIVIICISAAQAHSHCWSTSPLTSTRGRLPIERWGMAHHTSYSPFPFTCTFPFFFFFHRFNTCELDRNIICLRSNIRTASLRKPSIYLLKKYQYCILSEG